MEVSEHGSDLLVVKRAIKPKLTAAGKSRWAAMVWMTSECIAQGNFHGTGFVAFEIGLSPDCFQNLPCARLAAAKKPYLPSRKPNRST